MTNRRDFLRQSIAAGGAVWPHTAVAAKGQASKPFAMMVATTSPPAIRSGVDVMRRGGSAADAVLTTALEQIARCVGCWVSYAGRMTAVYYEAQTGKVRTLNACYDAPRHEDHPESIPKQPTPSGRNVLVPGFMSGVHALHSRFGNLKFADLFDPAIAVAEDGMLLSRQMANLIRGKATVLTRFAAARNVFTKDGLRFYEPGDQFRQPQLARTLKRVASVGADYMVRGEWAENFVQSVRAVGGKITLHDLEAYRPTWADPLETTLASGIRVCALPVPNRGGPIALSCLNLSNHAHLDEFGHYTESVEALRRVLKIEAVSGLIARNAGRGVLAKHINENELSLNDCADPNIGKRLWRVMQSPAWQQIIAGLDRTPCGSPHSDAIVAIDPHGNVAAILHTINTGGWGTTGLFVNGVSIPDSGAFQQAAIRSAGPGGRISDHGPPMIALKDGVPILAGSATGSGNVTASWQNFVNVLQYRMTPQQAADAANFYGQTFEHRSLSADFLSQVRAADVSLNLKPRFSGSEIGFWCGLSIDAQTGKARAGKIRRLDGIAVTM